MGPAEAAFFAAGATLVGLLGFDCNILFSLFKTLIPKFTADYNRGTTRTTLQIVKERLLINGDLL